MNHVVIRAEQLSKCFRIGAKQKQYYTLRETLVEAAQASLGHAGKLIRRARSTPEERAEENFWALRDVSFEINQGDVVGVIGRNGAGKSTLLKILSRITQPSEGYVDVRGRVGSLLEVGTGFHYELTGRENIFLNGAVLGMRRSEIERQFDKIVEFAEVERFVDTPVKHYSTGMYMRLAFGVAAHLQTDILLIDEVLAVGDAAFQAKCLGRLGDVASHGRTVLFVSHNMGAVRNLCDKGIVLDEGRIAVSGGIEDCIEAYYRSIGALGKGSSGAGDVFGPILINGSNDNTVEQAEGFEVTTRLRFKGQPEGFTLSCRVEDMHGRLICLLRAESTELGYRKGDADRTVSLRFPPLWLNPGLYAVDFTAEFSGQFSAREVVVSDKHPLDIVGQHSPTDRKSRVSPILNPQANWSLSNGVRETLGIVHSSPKHA